MPSCRTSVRAEAVGRASDRRKFVVMSITKGDFVVTSLRKRMPEDLQIRNYAASTVRAYILRVAEFAKHFGKSPDQLGAEQIREYQLFLIKQQQVSQSAYIQTVCGLRFLYTHTLNRQVGIEHIALPRYEKKLPIILSREEVKAALLEVPKNLGYRNDSGHHVCIWSARIGGSE